MKNLIVQIDVPSELYKDSHLTKKGPGTYGIKGKGYKELKRIGTVSEKSFRAYATKCEADYVVFKTPVYNWVSPSFERMRLIVEDKWVNEYDNILYVDYDILCHPNAPNIFTEFPQDAIRVVTKKKLEHGNTIELKKFKRYNITEQEFKKKFFNAGVMLFNKKGLRLLKKHENFKKRAFKWRHGCQGEMNFCIMKHNIPMIDMGQRWNKHIRRRQVGLENSFWENNYFFHFVSSNKLLPNSTRMKILKRINQSS